jgi:hypothetical protein
MAIDTHMPLNPLTQMHAHALTTSVIGLIQYNNCIWLDDRDFVADRGTHFSYHVHVHMVLESIQSPILSFGLFKWLDLEADC